MHETVTKSTSTTNTFYPHTRSPIIAAAFDYSQPIDSDGDPSLENWHLLTPTDALSNLKNSFYTPSKRFSKHGFSSMPTRTDNGASERSMANGQRWRFNTNGQLINAEAASAEWELADEIVRLKIGEVTGDADDIHRSVRTPPKSKLASAAVAQLSDASPLDTSSSVGSSPHAPDHQISISHSRGSSTDTTISSSHESVASNTLLTRPPFKAGMSNESKERPHSFSGGLSSADLRRLQHAGDGVGAEQLQSQQSHWVQNQYREPDQLSYPSLTNHVHRQQSQGYDYRSATQPVPQASGSDHDEHQSDYSQQQQQNYNHVPHGQAVPPPQFVAGRPGNQIPALHNRNFPQQPIVASPNALAYPGALHTSHLSLGNTQQLYDMMLPVAHDSHPAVARVQQHTAFRGTHHHSASDPSAIRDAATLALLNNNIQAFAPRMFQPGLPPPALQMYPNQFYGAQDVAAQVMAARLQSQYNSQYAVMPQSVAMDGNPSSPASTAGQSGPSANNRKLGLYKTELCRSWEEKGSCRYGAKCQFAHGEEELRKVARHPKYKTEICRTFWVSGSCPYGKRCCFIHTELPAQGATPVAPGPENTPVQPRPDGRARSSSTASDPNESISLLARISAKRNDTNSNTTSTPVDMNSNGLQFSRPPTGSLRVDTSALDGPSVKQNKSAYPSFASNGILLPAPEHIAAKSPAPVTAGPDLGRHNNSRLEIVGFNNQQAAKKSNNSSSNIRHSFNGTEVDLNFSSPPAPGHPSYALSTNENSHATNRANGHVRAGSAGNWASFSRSHLSSSPYPNPSSPAGDLVANSPWPNNELAVNASRLHEKAWA